MSPQNGWYDFFNHIFFDWKKNRESRREYLFVGFLVGMFMAIEATVTVFALANLFSEFKLRTIGGLLGTWALTSFTIWFLIAWQFGYKDLSSVIKNHLFKWSVIAGILFMIIGMIVLRISLPTP